MGAGGGGEGWGGGRSRRSQRRSESPTSLVHINIATVFRANPVLLSFFSSFCRRGGGGWAVLFVLVRRFVFAATKPSAGRAAAGLLGHGAGPGVCGTPKPGPRSQMGGLCSFEHLSKDGSKGSQEESTFFFESPYFDIVLQMKAPKNICTSAAMDFVKLNSSLKGVTPLQNHKQRGTNSKQMRRPLGFPAGFPLRPMGFNSEEAQRDRRLLDTCTFPECGPETAKNRRAFGTKCTLNSPFLRSLSQSLGFAKC